MATSWPAWPCTWWCHCYSKHQLALSQLTWCNIPEDLNVHQHCCANLKFCIVKEFSWWARVATRYGLDGLGMESWWGKIFRTCPDWPWGPPSLLYSGYWVSFLGVKWPGRGIDHAPPSSAEVKERVELCLCSPSGPSWPVLGWPLPLHLNELSWYCVEM